MSMMRSHTRVLVCVLHQRARAPDAYTQACMHARTKPIPIARARTIKNQALFTYTHKQTHRSCCAPLWMPPHHAPSHSTTQHRNTRTCAQRQRSPQAHTTPYVSKKSTYTQAIFFETNSHTYKCRLHVYIHVFKRRSQYTHTHMNAYTQRLTGVS